MTTHTRDEFCYIEICFTTYNFVGVSIHRVLYKNTKKNKLKIFPTQNIPKNLKEKYYVYVYRQPL